MFLTNKQKVKRYDKYERQKKDITRLRAEIESMLNDIDKKSSLLKQKQNELKTRLEEFLGRKQ